ncbi:hypothetical protein C8R45DRAFT_1218716 [Mycena sanguinolenta]|nr:hypothetical protein C8R45DRAFT_1218716 [Mycena sanguinolenta]
MSGLGEADVLHAIQLIQTAYGSPSSPAASGGPGQQQDSATALHALNTALRTPAAWGLVVPLLAHPDPNVQFFGAHAAHSKIARGELASLAPEEQRALKEVLVTEAGVQTDAGGVRRARVVRRKVYAAVVALAIRLVPAGLWASSPAEGEAEDNAGSDEGRGWVEETVRRLVASGAGSADVHEFLAGAAEDVGAANLAPLHRIQVDESLRLAAPLVLQSIATVLSSSANSSSNNTSSDADLDAALTCLVAWLPNRLLPDMDVARLVPLLIALLPSSPPPFSTPGTLSGRSPTAVTTTLSELLSRPPSGWGPSVLLEPLLAWVARRFPEYVHTHTPPSQYAPTAAPEKEKRARLRTHAKLLIALADATVEWVAGHLVDFSVVSAPATPAAPFAAGPSFAGAGTSGSGEGGVSRATLAQTLVRVMLALTAVDAGGTRVRFASASPSYPSSAQSASAPNYASEVELLPEDQEDEGDDEGDEEDDAHAGAPLGFWYLLQEALWEIPAANAYLYPTPSSSSPFTPEMDADDPERFRRGSPWTPAAVRTGSYSFGASSSSAPYPAEDGGAGAEAGDGAAAGGAREGGAEAARTAHARAAYVALVRILRVKTVCISRGKDREWLERFGVYRRDVGDTIVNAYYVLRDDLLVYLVGEAAKGGAWETIEAPLFLLRAVHEALDLDSASTSPSSFISGSANPPSSSAQGMGTAALERLFGAEVWGRLPQGLGGESGKEGERDAVARLRRTALGLVETYAAYFTTRAPEALLAPLGYVLGALRDADRGICLQAALALRSLCDANRRALAARISAFAEVHAGLGGVPDSEKAKVLQSIASVIQALPPAEAVAPVEAMVGPVLQRLAAALGAAGAHPEPARASAILQLEILAGVAKGLTRTTDPLAFDDADEEGEDGGGGPEGAAVRAAREDPRAVALRAALFDAIAQVAELWSADAEVGQTLSELFKAITALPADVTLLSLPAGPLLGVVCRAASRRLTGVWLALAAILIAQLNPPPLFLTPLKSGPTAEAEACVREAVGAVVSAALTVLGAPGGMVENPDIVQEFFACMDRVAQDFTTAFCALPDGAFDALMQCAISALALQERYSLVAACTFLGTLIHRVALYAPISQDLLHQLQIHMIRAHGRALMRAVLCGFAGAAPRSVTSNLLELLAALVSRWDDRAVGEAEGEMREAGQVGGGARGWVAEVMFADDFFPSRAGREDKERLVKAVVSSRSVKKTKEAANQFTIVAWGLEGSTFGYSSVSSV